MTREEAIEEVEVAFDIWESEYDTGNDWSKEHEARDMAIKALEQEPCEDAISRQAVEKITWEEPSYSDALNVLTEVRDKVRALPSVTPTRKKGKWINKSHTGGCGIKFVASECTCCGKKTFFDCDQLVYKYCPNCGCKMSEGGKE